MNTQDTYQQPGDLDMEAQEALSTLLYRLADDELVVGERYQDWIVKAPTIESDLSLANITQDEFGHARLWYDLLKDFGHTEADLIFERKSSDFVHSTLVERSFSEGAWADVVVRGYFYDIAEQLRLLALEDSSYAPLANRVPKVLDEEQYHRDYTQSWIVRLTNDANGRERVQAAVDRLFPYALTLFEPTGGIEPLLLESEIRTQSLEDTRSDWYDTVSSFLTSYGVDLPELSSATGRLPEQLGRDRTHTDDWHDLHAEMTRSYRDLGRVTPERVMEDPT